MQGGTMLSQEVPVVILECELPADGSLHFQQLGGAPLPGQLGRVHHAQPGPAPPAKAISQAQRAELGGLLHPAQGDWRNACLQRPLVCRQAPNYW